jgi:phosphate/sulfate permease
VHWAVVGQLGLAWIVTLPVTAALGGLVYALSRVVA